MGRGVRLLVGGGAVLSLGLAAAFAWGAPWATALWPVSAGYYGAGLSQVFAASVLASVGVSGLWVAAFDEGRTIAGGALDLAVVLGGPGIAGLLAGGHLAVALPAVALALLLLLLARRWHREPYRDARPLPGYLRAAFWVFVIVLAAEGTLLLLGDPRAFPWPLSRGNEVIYACVFLGAMLFFLYALRHPAWGSAGALLAGFLAYDLVLIGPLLGLLDEVSALRRPSLLIYIAAVGASGLLAAWALFLDPRTRLGGRPLPRLA